MARFEIVSKRLRSHYPPTVHASGLPTSRYSPTNDKLFALVDHGIDVSNLERIARAEPSEVGLSRDPQQAADKNKLDFSDPHDWAAFILIGVPDCKVL